ncbi:hypothetical protein M8J75_003324 [Diaphorina citri]|nr:hypothetical protein M8J75_003324 [Diaphorina citri]
MRPLYIEDKTTLSILRIKLFIIIIIIIWCQVTRMFDVIEFEGGLLETIPTSWVIDGQCYYPVNGGSHLKVCSPDTAGKTCCSAGMEEAYRLKAKQDFKRMYLAVLKGFKEDSDPPLDEALRQHAADIHGILNKTPNTLQTGCKEDSDPPLDEAVTQHAADIHDKFLLTELYF